MNPWFLLHTHSIMAFIICITQVGMLAFLIRVKKDIPIRKWMIINYTSSSIWYFDQIFRFSIVPGAQKDWLLYKLETVFIYSPAFAMLMIANFQVYYLFLRPMFERERKLFIAITVPMVLLFVGVNAWNEFANESDIYTFQLISFIWGMITNVWTLTISIRKAIKLDKIDQVAVNGQLLLGSVSFCYITLSLVNLYFGLYSPLGYWTFFILLWLGSIIMIVTYLTYSSIFVSFQIKIAGYSFVAVITFLTVVTLVFHPPIMPDEIELRLLQQDPLIKMFIILAVASVLISLLLPAILRNSLTNPLKSLLKAVKQVNEGTLNVEVPVLYRDEIGSLTVNFNKMTQTLRQTNEQLLEYTQTLTELYTNQQKIQEQTLNHVSQELHDNVGQLLSLVKVQLNLASEKDGLENQLLLDARENISRAMMDLRDMAKGMSSERIRVLGLLGSVEQEADRIRRTGICDVFITKNGKGLQMDHQKETILFRVIQECLQNIIKHAQATKIEMVFSFDLSHLSIEVHDDGKGFLLTRENNLSGMGLMNIQHRIQLMKGKVLVQSEPGSGTHVRIVVPLETNE